MNRRPKMWIMVRDNDILVITSRAATLLRAVGQSEQAREMTERVARSHAYDDALKIIGEYVDAEVCIPGNH